MTIKLSSSKIQRLLKYYFQGLPQLSIAAKLGLNQGTASKYVNEFSVMVEEEGLETAAKEYGIMDIVGELHSLSAELKKSNLTVEDAKKAFKVAAVLEECGIPEEEYKNIIATCTKMSNEGFLESAMELDQIEKNSDMTYQEIVKQASEYQSQLQNDKKELLVVQGKIGQTKQALAALEHQKADAEKALKKYMEKLDVDFQRIEKIESLAVALKKADIPDKEIEMYVERQDQLNKAKLSISMFNQILVVAKVQTIADGGKNLVKKLNEYNGLDSAVVDLKQEKQSLVNETKDLNEKAELKGSLQADVTHLETQKKGLQAEVSRLQSIMQTTQFNVQVLKQDENGLLNNVSLLKETVSKNELIIKNQDKEIKTKQTKVADLTVIESKRADIVKEIADLDIKADSKKKHLMILESFEGYVQSTSLDQQEQFIATLPQLLKEVQQKNNSPELIRASIFQRLTGGTMKSLKCGSCNAEFSVDKPAGSLGYHCPACGISHGITEAKDEPAILKEFFTMTEPKINNPVIQVETKSSMKTALPPNTPEKSYFNVTNNGQWHQV